MINLTPRLRSRVRAIKRGERERERKRERKERVCGLNSVYIHLISIDTPDDHCFYIRRAQYIPSTLIRRCNNKENINSQGDEK